MIESGTVLSKGKNDKLRGSLPSAWNKLFTGVLVGKQVAKAEKAQRHITLAAHTAKIPAVHGRYPALLQLTKTAKGREVAASLGPAVSARNCTWQLLPVFVKGEDPGCVLWTWCRKSLYWCGSHLSAQCNKETGKVDPGRKWKKIIERNLADNKTEGKDQWGTNLLGVSGDFATFHDWKVTHAGCLCCSET